MRKPKQTPEEAAKSRLMARGRKLMQGVQRYERYGYVTSIEDYEADDRKLLRGIDGLYDSARKLGLGEDTELQEYRLQLRQAWSHAREVAFGARRSLYESVAAKLLEKTQPSNDDPGFAQYRQELSLVEERRRARLKR